MVGKTPRALKSHKDRMDTISVYCGCLPCLLMGTLNVHTTIEHVTERGRRKGEGSEQHLWTIGLCMWHHFGHTKNHITRQSMAGDFGPPLTFGRHIFEDHFGDEVRILVPTQDFVLAQFAERPWQEYDLPRDVARDTRTKWIELNHADAQSA